MTDSRPPILASAIPVVAVDGPGGVGKGTVTRWLARRLGGWHRLDSGMIYRLAALAVEDAGIDPADEDVVAARCETLQVEFEETGDGCECVTLEGVEVGPRLRLETTGSLASRISALPRVRDALLDRQRRFRRPPGLVADGRDMGTVVFPDAALKLFLDAAPQARARRRWLQLRENGITANLKDLYAEIEARDARDRNRHAAPLRPAAEAVVIDTTRLSVAAVEARIEELLVARGCIR